MHNRASHPVLFLVTALLTTLAAVPSLAEEPSFEVSAVVEPSGSYSEYRGFDLDTGLGFGLGWHFAPRWTGEVRALFHDGDIASTDTYQLGVRYAFDLGGSWHPFAVGGVHYGRSEVDYEVVCFRAPCPPHRSSDSVTGLFAGGGADWQFSRRTALRLEGRFAVYDSDAGDDSTDATDLTAGIVVRF